MRVWAGLVFVASFALTVSAQPAPDKVFIDASQIVNEVEPNVFGANFRSQSVIPLELTDQAIALGITFLRFPGGRVGDLGDIPTFQIDLFMSACRILNCTPAISARLENGTPEKAAEMVRYVNITKGYDVRYWSIGNETNLFDDYTAERAASEWRTIAEAMLEVDPDIVFVGPDTSQFTGNLADSNGRAHDFLHVFLQMNGDMVDIVSVHRYPFGTDPATIDSLREDAAGWTELIANLHQFVLDELGHDLPVAITEVNSDWSSRIGGEATPDTFANALWWADVFGQILGGDLDIVAYFAYQTSDRLGGHGLLGRYELRPTYYVYQLYKQFGTQIVAAETDSDLRVYAALRDDGAVTIMLINWDDTERFLSVDIGGLPFAEIDAQITDFIETDGIVTATGHQIGTSFQQTLAPRSIRLIVIPTRPS